MRFAALSSLLKVNGEDIVGVRALNPLAFDGFEQLLHKHFMRIFSKFPNENVTEPGKIYFTPNHASTSPKQPPFASPFSLTHTHTSDKIPLFSKSKGTIWLFAQKIIEINWLNITVLYFL